MRSLYCGAPNDLIKLDRCARQTYGNGAKIQFLSYISVSPASRRAKSHQLKTQNNPPPPEVSAEQLLPDNDQ